MGQVVVGDRARRPVRGERGETSAARGAQVEIVEVVSGGDVTAEGVVIRNQGNSIDLNGWTLTDSEGNTYTFSQRLVFSNASVTLFTRTGTDTPVVLLESKSGAVCVGGYPDAARFGRPRAIHILRANSCQLALRLPLRCASSLPLSL